MNLVSLHSDQAEFEKHYIALRQKEKRLYSDDQLIRLPGTRETHPHYAEWRLREESASRLRNYLSAWKQELNILELGCGNGWLAHYLSEIPGFRITGMDINFAEISQAKRVFGHLPSLRFIHGDMQSPRISAEKFDCIIMAACIQYFSSPKDILSWALQKLKTNGEVHILDSHFYKTNELPAARKRSAGYYNSMGAPELTEFYFHHSLKELEGFSYSILYRPSFINRHIRNNRSPFPWIRVKRNGEG